MNPYEKDYNAKKAEYDRLKSIIDQASKSVLTPSQQALLSQSKNKFTQIESEWLAIKKKYESRVGEGTVGEEKTGNINLSTATNVSYTAPNGKNYTITWNGKEATFRDINGNYKPYPSIEAAKAYIASQNPVGQADNSVSQQAAANLSDQIDLSLTNSSDTKKEGLQGQQGLQTQVNATGASLKQTEVNTEGLINAAFDKASKSLTAAQDLQTEAENIYGQAQITSQYEDLIKKGLNPAKAKQASLFVNLKGRAQLSAKIATIKADIQKTIADLEMKRVSLIVDAKNKGMDNEKRVIDQSKAIETQVNNIKDQYNNTVLGVEQTYKLTPLLNVYSNTLDVDVKNAVQNVQNTYDTSTTQGKVLALARVLGDSFASIDGSIYNSMDLPFDQLLVKAISTVRKNKK